MTHQCDDECVCPLDGKPLLYAPASNEHACQDPDCANAHGVLPELTREDALELVDDLGQQAYRAENRLAFVREMCDAADRDGKAITTEQVRAWTQYTGCGGILKLPEETA